MNPHDLHHDLRAKPWIPVERLDGTADVVSIRGALSEANQIRRISGEIPGEGLALLRLLLALVYCIYNVPAEASEKEKRELWHELSNLG